MEEKLIALQDARILWNEKNGKINDFEVFEFKKNTPSEWPMHLYAEGSGIYTSDIGNCLSDWDKWEPMHVVVYVLTLLDFKDIFERQRAMVHLLKIKEINEVFKNSIASKLFLRFTEEE